MGVEGGCQNMSRHKPGRKEIPVEEGKKTSGTLRPVNPAVLNARGRAAWSPAEEGSSNSEWAGQALQELCAAPGSGFLALLTQFGHLSPRPFLENR